MNNYALSLVAAGVVTVLSAACQPTHACEKTVRYVRTYPARVVTHRVVQQVEKPIAVVEHVEPITVVRRPKPQRKVVHRVHVRATLRVAANFLGTEPGLVSVTAGEVVMRCEIRDWTSNSVEFTLPNIGLISPAAAQLSIVRSNGQVAKTLDIELIPPPEIVETSPGGPIVPVVEGTFSAPVAPQLGGLGAASPR